MNILRQIISVTLFPQLALMFVGNGVDANSLSGPFLFDDYPAILNNGDIRELSPLWRNAEASERSWINSWLVVRLSLALNYACGGFADEGGHSVNVALHIAYGLAFYALILRGVGGRDAPAIRLAAFSGSLLWLVHPLNSRPLTSFTLGTQLLIARIGRVQWRWMRTISVRITISVRCLWSKR